MSQFQQQIQEHMQSNPGKKKKTSRDEFNQFSLKRNTSSKIQEQIQLHAVLEHMQSSLSKKKATQTIKNGNPYNKFRKSLWSN